MKRKILSLALALAMCLSLTAPALAGSEPPEEVSKTYFSIKRNGEDELTDKFLTDEKITVVFDAKPQEDYYRVISANDRWEITHTGGEDCTIWISMNTYQLVDGQYSSMIGHDSWRVNTNTGESYFYDTGEGEGGGLCVVNLKPGDTVSFSTSDFLAMTSWHSGVVIDNGDGQYVYELGVNMNFSGGDYDDSWASYYIWLMLDEAAVADIKNGNVNKPTEPSTPEEPDTPTAPTEFTPIVTATPTTAAVGDTTVVVLLDVSNGTFSYGRLHDAMGAGVENFFKIDTGTTGLVLTDVEPVQPLITAALYQAKLTFTANGGAQAGTLKITPLAFSFASYGKQPTDANTVTVTVSGGSTPDTPTPPPVIPDIPYIPSIPSTSTGGSNTTTDPSTSTTTTPATDTVTNPDGSTTTTKPDGTVITTATDAAGNKTTTTENPNGSTVTTIESKNGGSSTTTVSANGRVTATVTVPAAAVTAAQASGQAIALPMPEVPLTANTASAPIITVTTGSSQPVKVEIPVERTTPGTVAVIVNADGTEEVVKTSLATANGVTLTVASGATVKIVDNSKSFADTATHWAGNAITFATAHELFNGTGADSFTPDGTMTRGMMVTVLARYDGVDTTAGATWYEKGVDWAAANNISSGADLDAPVSREQLATMLYRYAAASGLNTAATGSLNGFPDAGSVSDYAVDAMAWAVGTGLIGGTDKGELNPSGSATRAEVATILMRFCENFAR